MATVFCHQRTSATGVRRLVVVRRDGSFGYQFIHEFVVTILDPAPLPWTGDAQPVGVEATSLGAFAHWIRLPPPVRYYAGQPDPADASRFTIRYVADGREGLVEGKLSDAGNTVQFRIVAP